VGVVGVEGVALGLPATAATCDGLPLSWQLAGAATPGDGLIKMHCLMQIMDYISW